MKSFFKHISKLLLFFFIIKIVACKNQPVSQQNAGSERNEKVSEISDPKLSSEGKETINIDQPVLKPSEASGQISTTTPEVKNELKKLPGPKGFIIKDKTKLREEPNNKSGLVETLKEGEVIYLLETAPVDERGYPTWFKVQTANNKTGWVTAFSVSFGH